MNARFARHEQAAAAIAAVSDDDLARLLESSEALQRDGYATTAVPGLDAPLFVKLLSLTELERAPEHWGSTANHFGLPPHYGYRIGGAGFGVRRELQTHEAANHWVLSGERSHFPLMHGHRVVPLPRRAFHDPVWPNAWADDDAIAARHAAIESSTHGVAVFLEHFPRNLLQHLQERGAGAPELDAEVEQLEARLLDLVAFINGRGLQHMDAHFENLLTDGEKLFLTDFGLAISSTFELGDDERTFMERHRSLDAVTVLASLTHAVFTTHVETADWRSDLRAFLEAGCPETISMPSGARAFLRRRAPLWLTMQEVYAALRADISTEFPAANVERLLTEGAL